MSKRPIEVSPAAAAGCKGPSRGVRMEPKKECFGGVKIVGHARMTVWGDRCFQHRRAVATVPYVSAPRSRCGNSWISGWFWRSRQSSLRVVMGRSSKNVGRVSGCEGH